MKGWNERRWLEIDTHEWASGQLRFLTAEQQGMYMRLLCMCWYDSDAKDTDPPRMRLFEDESSARFCGVTVARWKKISPAVLALFRKVDGYLVSDALTEQWERSKVSDKPSRSREGISPRLRTKVMERDGFRCRRCGRGPDKMALEVDHVEPVARGGTNRIENLQTLCWECNAGKTDDPPHDHDLRIVG